MLSIRGRYRSEPLIDPDRGGEAWRSIVKAIGNVLSETLFPGICCDCGQLFPIRRLKKTGAAHMRSFQDLLGSYLCRGCADRFREIGPPLCIRCGQPFESPHGPDHVCGQCQENPLHIEEARAAGLYEGPLRAVIHHLKFNGRDQLAQPLARLLWQHLKRHWQPAFFDRVVPVPLHTSRLRERGFNQAYLLVRPWPKWAAQEGLALPPGWIDAELLQRRRSTLPQTGLKKEQRANNLEQAFQVGKSMEGESILLVDDVMTTGTTVDVCALALRRAGAAQVRVLTLARAVL